MQKKRAPAFKNVKSMKQYLLLMCFRDLAEYLWPFGTFEKEATQYRIPIFGRPKKQGYLVFYKDNGQIYDFKNNQKFGDFIDWYKSDQGISCSYQATKELLINVRNSN